MKPNSLVSFDIDGLWVLRKSLKKDYDSCNDVLIVKGIPRILNILKRHKIKSTFFVVGMDVENHRTLYKRIVNEGHEIGNHTFSHPFEMKSTKPLEIKREIGRAHDVIRDELKFEPIGFRSPHYILNDAIIETLVQLRYKYDSSMIPFYIPGMTAPSNLLAPKEPYKPSSESPVKRGNAQILEIPLSVHPVLRIPVLGTYIRLLGRWLLDTSIPMTKDVVNINFHPWDVFPEIAHEGNLPLNIYCRYKNSFANFQKTIELLSKTTNPITIQEFCEKIQHD